MNNQKLIMESWRSFLLEDVRNQESGILTGAYMQIIMNSIKDLIKKSKDENSAKGAQDLVIKGAKLEEDSDNKVVYDVTKLIKNYIKNSSVTKKNFLFFKSNKSKVLKSLKTFKLSIESKSGENFLVSATGGSYHPSESFTIKIGVQGFIDPFNLKKTFSWVNDFKEAMMDVTQHELEHASQKKSDIKDQSASSVIALLGRATREKVKKNPNAIKSFKTKVFDLLFGESEKSEKSKNYQNLLDNLQDEINFFNGDLGAKLKDEEVTKVLTYFIQPIELEAYTVGFVRRAKVIVDRKIKEKYLSSASGKKNWTEMPKEKRLQIKNKMTNEHFNAIIDLHKDKLMKAVFGKAYSNVFEPVIEKSIEEMKDIARNRFGSIK